MHTGGNEMSDIISREAVIDALHDHFADGFDGDRWWNSTHVLAAIEETPPAQSERDIPMKPNETTDMAWGIPKRQAVCPNCDYYLGNVAFLGDYKGKRITYCETCGQAIDWEGWEFTEET